MSKFSITRFIMSSVIYCGFLSLLHLVRIPWFLGIKGVSLFYLAAPCAAVSLPWFSSFLILLSKKLIWGLWGMSFMPITCNIPTFISIGYWTYDHWLIRFVIPISCIILFILHPTGYYAAAYTLYWFIPLILYIIPYRNLFLTALGATFVQHAIGSVIWLYMGSIPAEQWLALIPVVFFERMLSVFFMIGIIYSVKIIEATLHNIYTLIYTRQLSRA